MGREFGNLGIHVRKIITYSLSPSEQRLFAGFFSRGIPNLIRRFNEEVFYVAPGFIVAGLVYHYGTKAYEKGLRKNPADYENDE